MFVIVEVAVKVTVRAFGGTAAALGLDLDSRRPSAVSCDSQGAQWRLPIQAGAAGSVNYPDCNWSHG